MLIFNMADVMKLDFFLAKSKFRSVEVGWKKFFAGLLIFHTVLNIAHVSGCSNDSECHRGTCVDEDCVCDQGWTGEDCSHCGGRVKLDSPTGYIIDSVEGYKEKHSCTWLIVTEEPDAFIRLRFEHFETECCWDYLNIYDGDGMFSPMIAAYSGVVVPYDDDSSLNSSSSKPEVTTSSGYAYLHFYSDAALTMVGFNISYSVNSCPSNCSGNGDCIDAECDCNGEWKGEACDVPVCPSDCGDHGHCDYAMKECECTDSYKGYECEVSPTNGSWAVLDDELTLGRASLAAVVKNESVLIVGGYPFTNQDADYDFLVRYDIDSQVHMAVIPVSAEEPMMRYGHSVVLDRDRIIMYGGTVIESSSSRVVNELWFFNITTESWEESQEGQDSRPNLNGHTAHLVDDKMVVIFGYSPKYGYTNMVQEYDIVSGQWSILKTTGINVNGAYAHSSVYDEDNGMIYVYGGYKATDVSNNYLSDELYAYTPNQKHWSVLAPSQASYVYLHSAVLIGGMMYVFGGNPHNDTSESSDKKCYSPELAAYDIRCNTWSHLPLENEIYTDLSRFGHTAVTYNDKMYILSGFDGGMLQDVPIYTPGDCTAFTNKDDCVASSPGISCLWLSSEGKCYTYANSDPNGLHEIKDCPEPTDNTQCEVHDDCNSCTLTYGCSWCGGDEPECSANCDSDANDVCTGDDFPCRKYYTCDSCQLNGEDCHWNGLECREKRTNDRNTTCDAPCADQSDCESCTKDGCMWCSTTERCVDRNSYVTSFPYGQCVSWYNSQLTCPGDGCSHYQTCEECHMDPFCGWCDDGSNTGLGACIEGSNSGPHEDVCPAWYFTDCPACQCNGHSNCTNETICENCQDNTQGDQCQECSPGYYGNPQNGGECQQCFCNGHSEYCDNETGQCSCTTKGIIGKECDRCDEDRKYYGDPTNGTCYYELLLNYRFTFNLTKSDDKSITAINFKCIINRGNRDIEFNLNADKGCILMVTYTSNELLFNFIYTFNLTSATDKDTKNINFKCVAGYGDRDIEFNLNPDQACSLVITYTSQHNPTEEVIVKETSVTRYRKYFSRKDFDFSSHANTTFYVYLSNFTVPFWFQISFSWRAVVMLDLLQFFVTFFSCFLSLLLIAAIIWKIKQKYDAYVRRRAHVVEMAQLASRPFATSCIEIEKEEAPADNSASKPRRKASALAIEPCKVGKAAVLNLLIRLPSDEGGYTPVGYNGLTFASALVQVNTKKNTEHKGSLRQRKHQNQQSVPNGTNCV